MTAATSQSQCGGWQWLEGADGDGVEHREGGRRVGLARCAGSNHFTMTLASTTARIVTRGLSRTDLCAGRAVRLRS